MPVVEGVAVVVVVVVVVVPPSPVLLVVEREVLVAVLFGLETAGFCPLSWEDWVVFSVAIFDIV